MGVKRRLSGRAHADPPYRCNGSKRISHNKSALLETINGHYAAALDLLPVDEMPGLIPRLLKAGLCVGFSDPVSNIIVNTIASYSRRVPTQVTTSVSDDDGDKEKTTARRSRRRRKKALSRAVGLKGTKKVNYWPPSRFFLRDMSVAERSLVALITFLTYYFRALPGWAALQYLRLANADLLRAVRLVEEDLKLTGGFTFGSRTTKTALKCAALAACHPNPRALVNRSYSLASRMGQFHQLLTTQGDGCLSCTAIESINGLLIKPHRKLRSLIGVTTAPPSFLLKNKQQPPLQPPLVLTKSLQSTLLHKIYGLYLMLLAGLPTDGLRMFYHRALLKAGYCYGPLRIPFLNIVLNTLWYKAMFPPEGELSVTTMICSRSLVLVARRSLDGLVAYIRTCFRMMSEHQAMHYLLSTELNLWGAIEMARQCGHIERTMLRQYGAYKAAATTSHHPDPDAVANFFVSTWPMIPFEVDKRKSFMWHVELIMQLLSKHCSLPSGSVETIGPVLSAGGSKFLSYILKDFKEEESFVCRKVNAMLKKYTQQNGGPEYELHVICGFNSNVGDGRLFGLHYGPSLSWRPSKTQFCHINFFARPRILNSHAIDPRLFFAECSNDEDAIDELSCWPVTEYIFQKAPGRCYYCEMEGAMIIHPDLEKYIGRDAAFESMACHSNMHIGSICDNESILDSVGTCEEDCIYFDASRDAKCAKFLNARGRLSAKFCPRLV